MKKQGEIKTRKGLQTNHMDKTSQTSHFQKQISSLMHNKTTLNNGNRHKHPNDGHLGRGGGGVRTWKFFIVWLFGWFQYGTRVGDCILPLK
jgi:hypothetical protein